MGFIKKYRAYIPFALGLIALLVFYSFDFPQGDDVTYTLTGGSLSNIWDFYKLYYMNVGARMANFLGQLFLLSELSLWKIVTPFIVMLMSFTVFYLVKGSLPEKNGDFLPALLCASISGLVPVVCNVFGDTYIWLIGSCNYLYPLCFMLVGIIPFYNRLISKTTCKAISLVSAVLLLVGQIMHEQISLAAVGFIVPTMIYLYKAKKADKYTVILSIVSFAIMVWHFTCPGAINRLGDTTNTQSGNTVANILGFFTSYVNNFADSYWLFTILIGVCSLYLLYKTSLKRKKQGECSITICIAVLMIYRAYRVLGRTGVISFSATITNVINILCVIVFVIYMLLCFVAFLSAAGLTAKYKLFSALFVAMWASQAIPAVVNGVGRPVVHIVIITLIIAVGILYEANFNYKRIATAVISVIAIAQLGYNGYNLAYNAKQYDEVLKDVALAKTGESNSIIVDEREFRDKYMYFNTFNRAYEQDFRRYYGIPDGVSIEFLQK